MTAILFREKCTNIRDVYIEKINKNTVAFQNAY